MALVPILVLSLLGTLGVLAVLLLVLPAGRADPLRRRVYAWRFAGLLVGGAVAITTARSDALGRGLLLAAPVFGLGVLGGALLGEVTLPAPAGGIRRAGLRTRRATDYLPRLLGPVVAAAGVLVLLPLTGVALTAGGPLSRLAGSCGHSWWLPLGRGLFLGAGLAALAFCWCLAVLLLPPSRPRIAAPAANARA
jgi:hypothetical protein